MNLIQVIAFSLTQGLAEFLPISSSGHLNLAQYFLDIKPSLALDVFLNTATLLSVLFFFRKKLSYFFKNLKYIIVATIPIALVGFFFRGQLDGIFSDVNYLPSLFLLTSAFLFSTKFIKKQNKKKTYLTAFIIGLIQSLALLPGISRSGITIFIALLLGLSSLEAFNFSFALFIPASIGALILNTKEISSLNILEPFYLITFLITFIVGLIALTILKKVLVKGKLWVFSIYTFLLSLVLFFIL
jgi:undecaprenyl-diphosphatase